MMKLSNCARKDLLKVLGECLMGAQTCMIHVTHTNCSIYSATGASNPCPPSYRHRTLSVWLPCPMKDIPHVGDELHHFSLQSHQHRSVIAVLVEGLDDEFLKVRSGRVGVRSVDARCTWHGRRWTPIRDGRTLRATLAQPQSVGGSRLKTYCARIKIFAVVSHKRDEYLNHITISGKLGPTRCAKVI